MIETVFLHLTRACNLRCQYCYFSASRRQADELTLDDYTGIWHDFVAVAPRQVVFTGGEPLLRPDLTAVIGGLRDADPDHRIHRSLNTNGHHLTDAFAEQAVGLVDEVRISLDALAERNDALRGPDNFAAALAAIGRLQRVGFEPKILVTVTRPTLPDLPALLALLTDHGVTRVNLNPFLPIGRGAGHPEWRVSPVEVAALAGSTRAHLRVESSPDRGQSCGVGGYLNILPNGDAYPCRLEGPEFYCGNILRDGLMSICHGDGPLGRAAGLGVTVARERAEAGLAAACLAEVLVETPDVPWRRLLPLRPISR
jgi:MoaA/NifB/PqqE/SkfB family radical SAM enzyme